MLLHNEVKYWHGVTCNKESVHVERVNDIPSDRLLEVSSFWQEDKNSFTCLVTFFVLCYVQGETRYRIEMTLSHWEMALHLYLKKKSVCVEK